MITVGSGAIPKTSAPAHGRPNNDPTSGVPRVEIDIFEAYGGDPDGHHQAVRLTNSESHIWGNYTGLAGSMFDGAFHTYGARITTDWIVVYYDGKELSRFPMSEFFRTPLYMLVAGHVSLWGRAGVRHVRHGHRLRARLCSAGRDGAAPNGTAAKDILNGGNFDDVLDVAGADKMSGGFGNDTLPRRRRIRRSH